MLPLPLILGASAAFASATGIGSGIHGAMKMKSSNKTIKEIYFQHEKNIERLKNQNEIASTSMDNLGTLELEILNSFEKFSTIMEQIQGKPDFKSLNSEKIAIPEYTSEDFKKVSVGANVLLGGVSGAAIGTAGGFAAAGATTSAVLALGTASTGTAISSLTGIAATNATLAALGGGAIAIGGGGIALGTTILSAASFGVGLLIGGIVFNISASTLSNKADEAKLQCEKSEANINKICTYLEELNTYSKKYNTTLNTVKGVYDNHLNMLSYTVNMMKKTDWNSFSDEQKLIAENTVLLVGLLYDMCKIQIVLPSGNSTDPNTVNVKNITETIQTADTFLKETGLITA